MKADKLILLCLAALVFSGCPLNAPPSAEEGGVNYYSKEIETSVYVDPDETFLMPIEQRIYNEQGKLTAISKHTYSYLNEASPAEYPAYKITRTDVYEVSTDGTETPVEYYIYTYLRDEYQWVDDDGNTVDDVDYVLLSGKSFSADDVLRLYYDVVYDTADPANYDVYLEITDREAAGGTITAWQVSTYKSTYADGVKRFRTEKYFSLDSTDTLILSKEFATWHDEVNEPYYYLYDLYHSFRSDDTGTEEEFYYFTRYSRNGDGYIYEQADYDYDYAASSIPISGDKSFTTVVAPEPFAYDIEFALIKDKATVLTTDYDSLGNIILDERSLYGELSEYTTYSYNRASELTDQLRYTRGGSLLHDRTTVRFTEEYRNVGGDEDVYHRLKETCIYKYYDYDSSNESQEARGLVRSASSFTGKTDEEIRQNMYEKMNKHYR